jgi:hypothetical protein
MGGDSRRLISVRKANEREQRAYGEALSKRGAETEERGGVGKV